MQPEEIELTRKEARELIDLIPDDKFEKLVNALDNAQGDTVNGETQTITIIIHPGEI